MERRKFVIGLGSLAAGGAAATGTGAFTTASVDRGANIRVSNDDTDAKLGFSTKVGYGGNTGGAARSEYARVNGGVLEIDFTGSDASGLEDSGMNPDSDYHFDKVFRIVNQGQKEVLVGIDIGNIRSLDAIESANVHVNGSADGAAGADLDQTLNFGTDPVSINNEVSGATLSPGESLLVDWSFETALSGYDTPFDETPEVSIGGVDVNA
ncbi:DUF1102 domain-containing protein [Halorubrum sp. Ea8]|uniref:DUF1102 domain-containing protein n=1 Tax=Halorubrum sp. Ea8 TaxID=1383841 RepID=UPI000B99275A|nr:DUF1102 domain-containing protein [Halorubrum sp. Ea8]OYR46020.1 hypothetical protein DJ74_15395 [Halorubrum sp. Ea8]